MSADGAPADAWRRWLAAVLRSAGGVDHGEDLARRELHRVADGSPASVASLVHVALDYRIDPHDDDFLADCGVVELCVCLRSIFELLPDDMQQVLRPLASRNPGSMRLRPALDACRQRAARVLGSGNDPP
jgi:hypothetical protein